MNFICPKNAMNKRKKEGKKNNGIIKTNENNGTQDRKREKKADD